MISSIRFQILTVCLLVSMALFQNGCRKTSGDANTPPVASFTINPSAGSLTTLFEFDATASHDAEDASSLLLARWDWENDGFWDTEWSSNKIIDHKYPAIGTYRAALEIKDTKGLMNATTRTVDVIDINPDIPTVVTDTLSNISESTAVCGGNVISGGNDTVTARGVCWSTNTNATIADEHTIDGKGTGKFYSLITGLNTETTYHVRAYATNRFGTAYGVERTFTTTSQGSFPTVITASITNITPTTASSGGSVVSEGSSPVISRGVCWDTIANPTIEDSHTTDGNGPGFFSSELTGLTPETPYYIRAYATNSLGTSYGNQATFTTPDVGYCFGIATVTYEGQVYHTIAIGTQCWLSENLNAGIRVNGLENQDPTNGIIEKYCYEDLESNCDLFGALYQWDEVMMGVATPGAKGICPDGWHIPTDVEWDTLGVTLGGAVIAGGKLKEAGTAHWLSPNSGASNSSGFTALPGGIRWVNGRFGDLSNFTYFWSSVGYSTFEAWNRSLSYNNTEFSFFFSDKRNGYSVRCLMDPPPTK